jgi:hypothetical protein
MPTALKKHRLISQAVPSAYLAGRRIKMLQPRCDTCQGTGYIPEDWWTRCTHFATKEGMYTEISFVPIDDGVATEPDPKDPDIQVVSEVQPAKRIQQMSTLRLIQVALDLRVNSGHAVEIAQREGCLMPSEIGYENFCQALDCWNSPARVGDQQYGLYCSKFHYQLTVADVEGRVLEGLDERRRSAQLNEIPVPS